MRIPPWLPAVLCWLVLVVALATIPWRDAGTGDMPNVASALGYDIGLAILILFAWICATLAVVAFFDLPSANGDPPTPATCDATVPRWRAWAERLMVAAAVTVLYWPPAIARYGPHIEDTYFLTALWRMACGDRPYVDFEFLYGPLMIAPAAFLQSVTGFSMTSYYTVYTLLQVLFFVGLLTLLQRYVASVWKRYAMFVALVICTIDFLFGMNWIPWRYVGAIGVILILSPAPRAVPRLVGAAIVVGLQAAYSWEYGVATLLTGLAILVLDVFERPRPAVWFIPTYLVCAIATWAGLALLLTGAHYGDYLAQTKTVAQLAAALGLGQFAFYWTAHSLALFLLFAIGLSLGGLALRQLGRAQALEGDRHIVAALVFAIITLRIAFQRADFLHLMVPFVPLILVLFLNAPRRLMAWSGYPSRLVAGLVIVIALGHTVAYAPTAKRVLTGLTWGLQAELGGHPNAAAPPYRVSTSHASERSQVNPSISEIASALAAPDHVDKPVLFYGSTWALGLQTGVCPVGHASYEILYTDALYPVADLLETAPNLLVVAQTGEWDALGQAPDLSTNGPANMSRLERLAQVLGSGHFAQRGIENHGIESRMWRDAIGERLSQTYRPLVETGRYVILEPKQMATNP